MNWRLASRLSVLTMAVLVVIVVALVGARSLKGGDSTDLSPTTTASNLHGTSLDGRPAPAFNLKDQFGKPISLAQFKGMPVVVTFLYTHCPDVCPLTAEKLHTVTQELGGAAQKVAIVAISSDPKGDDQQAVLKFSNTHKMTTYWHYLIGTEASLSPVWRAYSIDAEPAASDGTVMHTDVIYVLDKQGNERTLLNSDFNPSDLAADLQTLLKS